MSIWPTIKIDGRAVSAVIWSVSSLILLFGPERTIALQLLFFTTPFLFGETWDSLGLRFSVKRFFIGVFLSLVLLVLAAGLKFLLPDAGRIDRTVRSLPIYLIAVSLLIAPVVEEIFFRGFLQRRLGLVAAALLFGLFHLGYGTWSAFVMAAVLGFILGLIKERWGLDASIGCHLTFNAVSLAGIMLMG